MAKLYQNESQRQDKLENNFRHYAKTSLFMVSNKFVGPNKTQEIISSSKNDIKHLFYVP